MKPGFIKASKLHTLDNVAWCKTRGKKTSKDYYKHQPSDLWDLTDVVELFNEFDDDQSGALDMDELQDMFRTAGISIPKALLQRLFRYVKTQQPGVMTVEEFKELVFDKKRHHKEFLELLRENERKKSILTRKFIPFSLYSLLKIILFQTRQKHLSAEIASGDFRDSEGDLQNFDQLFSLATRHSVTRKIVAEKWTTPKRSGSLQTQLSQMIKTAEIEGGRQAHEEIYFQPRPKTYSRRQLSKPRTRGCSLASSPEQSRRPQTSKNATRKSNFFSSSHDFSARKEGNYIPTTLISSINSVNKSYEILKNNGYRRYFRKISV